MGDFLIWFTTGLQHILDVNGYDHILYIATLTVIFKIADYKKVVLLITAFTIGHTATLAISALHIIKANQYMIELLIPVTIIITCIHNIYKTYKANCSSPTQGVSVNYFLALLFGFIHGLGFSFLLNSMLGKQQSVILPLLSFNLGLEVGQLAIVISMLLLSASLVKTTLVSRAIVINTISIFTCSVALYLFIERL